MRVEIHELSQIRDRLFAERAELIANIQANLSHFEQALHTMEVHSAELTAERDRLLEEGRLARRTHQEAIDNLNIQLSDVTNDRDRQVKEVERLRNMLAQVTAKRDELAEKVDELTSLLATRDEEIASTSHCPHQLLDPTLIVFLYSLLCDLLPQNSLPSHKHWQPNEINFKSLLSSSRHCWKTLYATTRLR